MTCRALLHDMIYNHYTHRLQDGIDDTLLLKERLASIGGLTAFQSEAGTSLGLALHAIEPVLSKVKPLEPAQPGVHPGCVAAHCW